MSAVDVDKGAGRARPRTEHRAVSWPLHAGFAATMVAFAGLYLGTFASLIYVWAHNGSYEHAFLIFPVSVFLIWLRRRTLRHLESSPRPIGLAAVGMLTLLWMAGALADVNLVRHFSVIAMIPCLVFTFYGVAITRALIFPLGYLFFAFPVGDFLVGPLQDVTARLSVIALQLTQVPVFVDGRMIMTPAGLWHVAEACSGVKFFIATTAFGVLYANLFYQSWRRRLIFVACALIVPIIANGLRVYFTILIGEYYGMQYATGTDHLIFGWQFFGGVLVLLFLAGWPWHEPEAEPAAPSGTAAGAGGNDTGSAKTAALAAAGLIVLALAPLWFYLTAAPSAREGAPAVIALPDSMGGLRAADEASSGSSSPGMVFHNADAYGRARYGAAGQSVRVFLAVYNGAPSEGHDLITYGNRLYDPAEWESAANASRSSAVVPEGFDELRFVQRRDDDEWLIWYGYRVGGRETTSKPLVKMWQAWDRLLGRPVQAMVVALAARAGDDRPAARQRLERTAADLMPWMNRNLGGRP